MTKVLNRKEAEQAYVRVQAELGQTPRQQVQAIIDLLPHQGEARLSTQDVVNLLWPGKAKDAALTDLRQLREKLKVASQAEFVLENENQKHDLTQRTLVFMGLDQTQARLGNLAEATPKPVTNVDSAAIQVVDDKIVVRYFLSYAHKDDAVLRRLLDRLTPLLSTASRYHFERWQDKDILLGEGWNDEIQAAALNCHVGLLVISPDFLASSYITQSELPHFVSNGATQAQKPALPVMLRPVALDGSVDLKGLGQRQIFMHGPANAKRAFSEMRGAQEQDAFARALFKQIIQRLDKVFSPQPPEVHRGWKLSRFTEQQAALNPEFVETEGKVTGLEHGVAAPERFSARAFMSYWLTEKKNVPYFAMLGEYGMGKTTTCRQFTHEVLQNWRSNPKSSPLPIYLNLTYAAQVAKQPQVTLEDILDEVIRKTLESEVGLEAVSAADIIQEVRERGGLVIFDGLDEVLVHLDKSLGEHFTRTLLNIRPVTPFSEAQARKAGHQLGRVIVSCRTHYFPTLTAQNEFLKLRGREATDYQHFDAIVLLPFTAEQVSTFLGQALTPNQAARALELIQSIHNLKDMAARPVTLKFITDLLGEIEELRKSGRRIVSASLYQLLVQKWLARDDGKHHLSREHKPRIMEHFALLLWGKATRSGNIEQLNQQLIQFLAADPALAFEYGQQNMEVLREDFRTATFLVREGEDQFRFAHASMHEFFVASALVRALRENKPEQWALANINWEILAFIGELLTLLQDEDPEGWQAAQRTLHRLRDEHHPNASRLALDYAMSAQEEGYPSCPLAGWQLPGEDLTGWQFKGTPEQPLDLSGWNLEGAYLTQIEFQHVSLKGANLSHLLAQQATLDNVSLHGANLENSRWWACDLANVDLSDANLLEADWTGTHFIGHTLVPDAQLHVLEEKTAQPPELLPRNLMASVVDLFFHPRRNVLIMTGQDGSLKELDLTTGRVSSNLILPFRGSVWSAAWSSDGEKLAGAGIGVGVVRVLSADGKELWQAEVGNAQRVAWSPDGEKLAVVGVGVVRVLSAGGKELWQAEVGNVWSVAWSPDGEKLAVGGGVGVRVLSATGKKLWQADVGNVWSVAWSPDGEKMAVVGVGVWVLSAAGKELWQANIGNAQRVAWSPDGEKLAVVGDVVRVLSATGKELWQAEVGDVQRVAWSPDGEKMAVVGVGVVRVLSAGGKELWQADMGDVASVAWSPDGEKLAVGVGDVVRVLSAGGKELWQAEVGNVWSVAWSPDGEKLAVGGDVVRVLSAGGKELWQADVGNVASVAWSPNGEKLAVGGDVVRVLSAGGKELWQAEVGDVASVAWSPDGEKLAVGVGVGVRVLSAGGKELWQAEVGNVWSVAWSPDGEKLAVGVGVGVRVLSATGKELWQADVGNVESVAWSPDGEKLAVGGYQVTVLNLLEDSRLVIHNHESIGFKGQKVTPADVFTASAGAWRYYNWRVANPTTGEAEVLPFTAFYPQVQALA